MTDTSGVVTAASPHTGIKRRQIRPKAERRQQLIDAAIRCIAQAGLSAVTMQMVTSEAGLSAGIANLHFESKENLLRETLRFVAEEYHDGQIEIMEGSRIPDLGERLDALLDFQLGHVYEINNQKQHSVMNKGDEGRINFIFDYVPPTKIRR